MAIVKQIHGKAYFNIPDEQLEKFSIEENKLPGVLKEHGMVMGVAGTPPAGETAHKLAAMQAQADASASYLRVNVAICPTCGGATRLIEDTERYRWYSCSYCGASFRF